MANSAAPQAFTFGTMALSGELLGFTGKARRSGALHRFIKRAGGVVEDMERDQRHLDVVLVFSGPDAAGRFNDFETQVHDNPTQLLRHPIAGQYQAFCEGPEHDVQFARATDEIRVRVAFIESELDASVEADIPDVATAAQAVSSQQSLTQRTLAAYTSALARVGAVTNAAKNTIDAVSAQISSFTDPLTSAVSALVTVPGVAASVIGHIETIQVLGELLDQHVSNFVDSATDVFNGEQVPAGAFNSSVNLMGVVQTAADQLSEYLSTASNPDDPGQDPVGTPGASYEAVGSLEDMVAQCLVLLQSVMEARPPSITVLVTQTTDLINFCQKRYPEDALARASDILGMNHIRNPAYIPAGTLLLVPSQ